MSDIDGQQDSRLKQGLPYLSFSQSKGVIEYHWRDGVGTISNHAWAGNHAGKNNPSMQKVRCVGPLPQGVYTILPPVTHPHLGPFAMKLEPVEGTDTFGRDGFWWHGASSNPNNYGQESMGCVISDRGSRVAGWETGARQLLVTE